MQMLIVLVALAVLLVWLVLVLKSRYVSKESVRVCPHCQGNTSKKMAYDTGDGWYLHWFCEPCGDEAEYTWPYGDHLRKVSGKRLRLDGFEVV